VDLASWPRSLGFVSLVLRGSGRENVMKALAAVLIVIICIVVFLVAGVATYVMVSSTLSSENINVSQDATMFAGQHVDQPWEAFAEANVINEHANKLAGGKTYAELPQTDPNRTTVMNASFLQASLFTSVVAFGVAAMAAVVGAVFIVIGLALRAIPTVAAGATAPATSRSAA